MCALSYFNLNPRDSSKSPDLSQHTLTLPTATHQTLLSSNPGIPDGTLTPHPDVPYTNKPFPLYDAASSSTVQLDDCFIVSTDPSSVRLDTRPEPLHLLAELHSSATGISLRVESSEPAFQCYTGKFMDVPAWPSGQAKGHAYPGGPGFAKNAGVCIEPSRFVNAAACQDLRSMVLLKKGSVYGARTRYTAWQT